MVETDDLKTLKRVIKNITLRYHKKAVLNFWKSSPYNNYCVNGLLQGCVSGSESGSVGSMFLGLLDLDPDPLVRNTDPDPDLDPFINQQK
jgi:hypothetical protein